MKLNIFFCIWILKISWFPFNISILSLIAVISSALLELPNKKLNREWIIPLLVQLWFDWSGVVKMLFTWLLNSVIWSLQPEISFVHNDSKAEEDKFCWFVSYDLWS